MALFEIPNALRHARDDAPAWMGLQDPIFAISLWLRPDRHKAGWPIRQHPIGPILVLQCERAAQFYGVDSEPLENVLVDDCELLDRVVHAERPAWETEEFAEPNIRH